ncbi:hypothetical protein ACOSQ4_023549 [Xanthoceras sorbifolium]
MGDGTVAASGFTIGTSQKNTLVGGGKSSSRASLGFNKNDWDISLLGGELGLVDIPVGENVLPSRRDCGAGKYIMEERKVVVNKGKGIIGSCSADTPLCEVKEMVGVEVIGGEPTVDVPTVDLGLQIVLAGDHVKKPGRKWKRAARYGIKGFKSYPDDLVCSATSQE